MPPKKSKPEMLTKEFLVEQLQSLEKRFDSKIEYVQKDFTGQLQSMGKRLETRIGDSRRDAKEQLESVAKGLDKKIDAVEKSLRQEIHYTQLAVKEVKNDTVRIEKWLDKVETKLAEHDKCFEVMDQKIDRISDKLTHHDEEIVFLKAAMAK